MAIVTLSANTPQIANRGLGGIFIDLPMRGRRSESGDNYMAIVTLSANTPQIANRGLGGIFIDLPMRGRRNESGGL